jgi:hypothetical protein
VRLVYFAEAGKGLVLLALKTFKLLFGPLSGRILMIRSFIFLTANSKLAVYNSAIVDVASSQSISGR